MSEKIVQLNEEVIKGQLKGLTRQCRGNPQRAAGGRSREVDPSGPVRAQRAAPGLPKRPLQP